MSLAQIVGFAQILVKAMYREYTNTALHITKAALNSLERIRKICNNICMYIHMVRRKVFQALLKQYIDIYMYVMYIDLFNRNTFFMKVIVAL